MTRRQPHVPCGPGDSESGRLSSLRIIPATRGRTVSTRISTDISAVPRHRGHQHAGRWPASSRGSTLFFAGAHSFFVPAPQKSGWCECPGNGSLPGGSSTGQAGYVSLRPFMPSRAWSAGPAHMERALPSLLDRETHRQTTNVPLTPRGVRFLSVSRGSLAATATLTIAGWSVCCSDRRAEAIGSSLRDRRDRSGVRWHGGARGDDKTSAAPPV